MPLSLDVLGWDLWQVPGYEMQGVLGRGGMGVVFKARHLKLGRVVALKVLLSAVHASEEAHQRFTGEARAVARLQHPNIVQIHEVGEHGGLPYCALEYCSGGTLAQKLKVDGRMSPREAADLVRTLALAVQSAHEQQIIHRDLKPANILLTSKGTPKVADFGLAKMTDEADRTHSGAVVGTPSYMAPEQARGKIREICPATDVYALGVILYECLTGRPPFVAESQMETLMQVIGERPVSPRSLRVEIPRSLESICLRCLAKDATQRYASAKELAEQLTAFLAGRSAREPISSWLTRSVTRSRLIRPIKGPMLMRGAIALLLLVLMLGVWPFQGSGKPTKESTGLLGGDELAGVERPRSGGEKPVAAGDRNEPARGELPNMYGLFVGVNDYSQVRKKGIAFQDLNWCVQDARAMQDVFHRQQRWSYHRADITLLTEKAVTRKAVMDRLDAIAYRVEPRDWVVLYLNGHGLADWKNADEVEPDSFYFVCHDTDRKRPETKLKISDVRAALGNLGCNCLVFLDVGHSGALANSLRRGGQTVYVFTACMEDQQANEALKSERGVGSLFSHALLTALQERSNGKQPQYLTLSNLQEGVVNHLQALLAKNKFDPDEQVPVFYPLLMPRVKLLRKLPR